MTVRVKICGVTSVADARACVDLGADIVGVNLVPASARFVEREAARAIAAAVRAAGVTAVAVVADLDEAAMRDLLADFDAVQLHGHERPEALAPLVPRAYKAVRVGSAEDVAAAESWPGEPLLVDAKVAGALGGTGTTFDWSLVRGLAARRKLLVAGGLTPDNVADAVRALAPWGVDVASGVERAGEPRAKDLDRVRAFVERAKGA